MDLKRQFWVLYIIFAVLNLLDYYSTAVCMLLPEFEEQNPLVQIILANGAGLFLEVKLSIIFFAGVTGGLIFNAGSEKTVRMFNRGLIVLNIILAAVCTVNISQLVYYLTA